MVDTSPVFTLDFGAGREARAVRVADADGVAGAVRDLGLAGSQPVVVVIGGAGGMADDEAERAASIVAGALVPAISRSGAVVVDGGTDAGVMRIMGRARADFPLVGVAAEHTVRLPGQAADRSGGTPLEPHHSHFLLVPGGEWGDEAPWLARAATHLAGAAPSVTLLVNGGEIAVADVAYSLRAGRPVLVLAGTGRTADRIVAARRGALADERITGLAEAPQVHIADSSDPRAVQERLQALLSPRR